MTQLHERGPGGPPAFAPIDAGQRIQAMDVVRGFALLGIFLMNIEWFGRPMQEMGSGIDPSATGIDHAAAWAVHAFVAGKFWVLFSLLFGMGFAVMSSRGGHGPAFRGRYLRRCLVLLGFGVLHAVLLWPGDILHAYAITGLLLLAFGEISSRARLVLGIGLYGVMALMIAFSGGLLSLVPADELGEMTAMAAQMETDAARAVQAYAHGSYLDVVAQRARDFASVAMQGLVMTVPMALGVFMLGAWLVRSGRVHDIASQRGFYLRLALCALPVGTMFALMAMSVGTSFDGMREMGPMLLANGLMMLGSLPLALGYFALLVLGLGVPGLSRVLGCLAPAGRMALTNYLLQSLIASTLFYGYGFGLGGQIGRAGQVALVFVVFALQLLASHWWLARHRFGPMEWLWRWFTYGARPPMRLA